MSTPRISLMMAGSLARLAGAALLIAVLWCAVAWALGGRS